MIVGDIHFGVCYLMLDLEIKLDQCLIWNATHQSTSDQACRDKLKTANAHFELNLARDLKGE